MVFLEVFYILNDSMICLSESRCFFVVSRRVGQVPLECLSSSDEVTRTMLYY